MNHVEGLSATNRLLQTAEWLGFVFLASVIFVAVATAIDQAGSSWLAATLVFGGGVVLSGAAARCRLPFWIALAVAFITLIALLAISSLAENFFIVGVLVIANVLSMLIAFRFNPAAYLAVAFGVGTVLAAKFDDLAIGFVGFLLTCSIFAFVNYLVKLVIDHSFERKRLRRLYSREASSEAAERVAKRAVLIWLWAAGFALLGLYLQCEIQNEIQETLYRSGFVKASPSDSTPPKDRDVHADLEYMVDGEEKKALAQFQNTIDEFELQGTELLKAFPSIASGQLEAVRPPRLDATAACSDARFRVLRRTVSLGGLCRGIVRSLDSQLQGSFHRAKNRVHDSLEQRSKELIAAGKTGKADAQDAGVTAIKEAYVSQRAFLRYMFLALRLIQLLSYIILLSGLIAALQMVTGRILFDEKVVLVDDQKTLDAKEVPDEQKQEKKGLRFRVGPTGTASCLDWNKKDVTALADLTTGDSSALHWYIQRSICRSGRGTRENVCIPQFPTCFLQRLFSGRLVMTKVDVGEPDNESFPAKISLPGDLKLVHIRLKPGQQVCFRVGDLAGFSSGILLRSVYSTHVGAHLLGLGSFHSYAEGDGYLLLISEGEQLDSSRQGLPTPATNLLAWDRRHEFSLEQIISSRGIWLNEPSVVLASPSGAAILDESRPGVFSVGRRVWRLLRYLVLPF